jgi:hypothetical protein
VNPLSHLAPVSDAEASALVSEDAFTGLGERIMSTPVPEALGKPRKRPRRWLIGTPVAVGLAAVTFIVSVAAQLGPAGTTPAMAQALTFSTHGQWVDVTVRDAALAPAAYGAALRAHGYDLAIQMVPGSPSAAGHAVGSRVAAVAGGADSSTETSVIAVPAVASCTSATSCPVGLRIPRDYHGRQWTFIFCRPAKPGEKYVITGPVTAPGEVMHGLRYRGKTVGWVVDRLRQRHATVAQFDYATRHYDQPVPAAMVPRTWFVYDATPWAPHQVQLFAGPTPAIAARRTLRFPTLPASPSPSPSFPSPGTVSATP